MSENAEIPKLPVADSARPPSAKGILRNMARRHYTDETIAAMLDGAIRGRKMGALLPYIKLILELMKMSQVERGTGEGAQEAEKDNARTAAELRGSWETKKTG